MRRGVQAIISSASRRFMAYEQSGKYLAAASLRMAHSTQSASRSLNMSWMSCVAGSVALIAGGAMTMPLISHAASPNERSFIMIKPDGVHRSLISDIIGRFERRGFKLVGIKILVPSTQLAGQHYDEHKERPFFPKLVNFLSSGAVVAMVWEGTDVIKTGRTMIGATNPLASPLGSIRGDYGIDTGRNIIHGSDSVEAAQREISLWFRPEELASYTSNAAPWIYEQQQK